jgi:hypothetical protein
VVGDFLQVPARADADDDTSGRDVVEARDLFGTTSVLIPSEIREVTDAIAARLIIVSWKWLNSSGSSPPDG